MFEAQAEKVPSCTFLCGHAHARVYFYSPVVTEVTYVGQTSDVKKCFLSVQLRRNITLAIIK